MSDLEEEEDLDNLGNEDSSFNLEDYNKFKAQLVEEKKEEPIQADEEESAGGDWESESSESEVAYGTPVKSKGVTKKVYGTRG